MTTDISLYHIEARDRQMANITEFSLEYNGPVTFHLTPRDLNPDYCLWFEAEASGVCVGHLRSILWGNMGDLKASEGLNLWAAADIFVKPDFRGQGVQRSMVTALMHEGLCDMIYIERNFSKAIPYYKALGFTYSFQAAHGWFLITDKAQRLIGSCRALDALGVFEVMYG